jgi:hypothetical protein
MRRGPGSLAFTATLLAAVLAACGSASPTPSEALGPDASVSAPVASASAGDPGPGPSGSAVPSETGVSEGAIVQVVADELRMRAEAGTASTLVGTLERGTAVRIESGPVEADGFTWFEVVDLEGRRGWAADSDGTDPWLAAIPDMTDGTSMLTLTYGCDVVGPINPPATTVMEDGRVIATDQSATLRWIVRQLSTTGLEEVRESVLESPYLQASAEYRPQPRADAGDPPGHGACSYTFTIPADVEPIVVTTIGWFGDEEERTFYEPSPERKSLDGIARNLIEIDNVLGEEAWEGPGLPYVAAEYSLHIRAGIGPAPEDVGSIEPNELGLGDIGSFGNPAGNGRCATVSRAQAFEVARVLKESNAGLDVRLDAVSFPYFATDAGWFSAALAPVFPDGQPDCASIAL